MGVKVETARCDAVGRTSELRGNADVGQQRHRGSRRRTLNRAGLAGRARRFVVRVVSVRARRLDVRGHGPTLASFGERRERDADLRHHREHREGGKQPASWRESGRGRAHLSKLTAEQAETLATRCRARHGLRYTPRITRSDSRLASDAAYHAER
jgi:hypothetical protein